MSTIKTANLQNGSSSSVNIALNTDGSATFAQMPVGPSYFAMRNKIINGAMEIDQRYGGASSTINNTVGGYYLDRWYSENNSGSGVFTIQQVSDAPASFVNSLKITTTTADATLNATDRALVAQKIEGFNVIDLAFGSASARTVTLSFWCKSSIIGTFGGILGNNAATRSYPFTYTISSANVWEYKTIVVTGETTGAWLTNNGTGLIIIWGLGVGSTYSAAAGSWAAGQYLSANGSVNVLGTLNATWQITGVQLEVGSVATPFERRNYQQELAMCYRYYRRYLNSGTSYTAIGSGLSQGASSVSRWGFQLDIPMRATPTFSLVNCVAWNGPVGGAATAANNLCSPNIIDCDLNTSGLTATVGLIAKVLMLSNGYVEVVSEL